MAQFIEAWGLRALSPFAFKGAMEVCIKHIKAVSETATAVHSLTRAHIPGLWDQYIKITGPYEVAILLILFAESERERPRCEGMFVQFIDQIRHWRNQNLSPAIKFTLVMEGWRGGPEGSHTVLFRSTETIG